jgi:hypothetical protein
MLKKLLKLCLSSNNKWIFISLITYINSNACDCIIYPVKSYYDTTQYVFVGKVINSIRNDTINKAEIEISYYLKGNKVESRVYTIISSVDNCGFQFEVNRKYLLFAYFKNEVFILPPCTLSDKKNKSRKIIREIKRIKKKQIG